MGITTFSFWFALVLSLGSLLFYLSGAIWNHPAGEEASNRRYDFNLGLPSIGERENLFAIALVAAGTSLSTVFVFFLTAGSVFGWWVLLCPLMFAAGNWMMFSIYRQTEARGYFTEQHGSIGAAGLVPYLGQRLTGSTTVGWLLVLLSILNLLAVLVLELVVAVDIFGYLAEKTFHLQPSSLGEFIFFLISVCLLLGYVFIGGFRAVVTSDVWQMKAMKWAVILTLVSIAILGFTSGTKVDLHTLSKSPPPIVLSGFIINVVLANLFAPLSQEASWQRFRAFAKQPGFKLTRALNLSVLKAVGLWLGLILVAWGLQLTVSPEKAKTLSSMSNVLEVIRNLNDWWFPLCIFPIMTVAALSAMYSTADTCVSALLYLIEYARLTRLNSTSEHKEKRLPASYHITMGIIFVLCLAVYWFVRYWFHPTIFQLIFSVFSNLVVISPIVITTTLIPPQSPSKNAKLLRLCVIVSLIVGSVAYWASAVAAMVLGETFLWLSQLSIVCGLVGSAIPMLPVWLNVRALAPKAEANHGR